MKTIQNTIRNQPFPALTAWRALGVLLLTCVAASPALAQNGPAPVVVTLKAQKVVRSPDGREKLQLADRARPGEIIQYDAIYRNQSADRVRDLQPTLPIPRGLELIPNSANPPPAQASLDGATFESIPLKRQVKLPSGLLIEETVPYSEYRALRWDLGELNSGQSATISARARLALN